MSQRFYTSEPVVTDKASIDGAEAHHLTHVMRAKVGDEVVLFDGSGSEFPARIVELSRKRVDLLILESRCPAREVEGRLDLAVALPRGDRQEWLTQKLVELGVTALIPWKTSRSVAVASEKSIRRLKRHVIEASKQCGRNVLMRIDVPADFTSVIDQTTAPIKLLAHPTDDAAPLADLDAELESPPRDGVWLGVGPEGGFTSAETDVAVKQGWRLVNLGPRILRTETAAMTLAAWAMLRLNRP